MKRLAARRRLAWLAVLACAAAWPPADSRSAAAEPAARVTAKKGIGLSERRGLGGRQLNALKVGWYYNWGAKTDVTTDVRFVPMIFSARTVDSDVRGGVVLGFNEPDNEKQSAMSVDEAVALWPRVAAKAGTVVSPAVAGDPIDGDWLPAFMRASPRIDCIAVHWYKGPNAKKFIRDVEEVHARYGKPVVVTEFAPQTASSSRENPTKYSQVEVEEFIAVTTAWMEATSFVAGYAWHDSKAGTSALFDDKGGLTATGRAYAAAGASPRRRPAEK